MSDSPYTVRNYRPSDLESYVKLRIAAEKQQPGGQCNTPETVREALRRPSYAPEQDLFIVSTTEKVIGFTDITPELRSGRVVLDCYVQPEHRDQGLGSQLHDQAMRHAKKLGAKAARISIWQDNTIAQHVLPRLGFQMVRRYLELWLPLTEVRLPDTSDIYSVRHLQPGEEKILAQIQNRYFADTWEYNPNTVEEIAYHLSLSRSSPDDVLLVYDADKPVGYCWARTICQGDAGEEKRGRIHMLGADPDYRNKGIGRIALLSGLTYLKSRNVQVVELTVDSTNASALALYHRVGFKESSSCLWYEKAVI